jgi:hypothetical protein
MEFFFGIWKGNNSVAFWLDIIYFHKKMADVLDIENQDEFEFDEDGDRKLFLSNSYPLLLQLFSLLVAPIIIPSTSNLASTVFTGIVLLMQFVFLFL